MSIILPLNVKPKSLAPPAPVFIDHMIVIVTLAKPGENEMATATLTWTPPTVRLQPDPNTPPDPLPPGEIAGAAIFDTASVTPTIPIGSVLGASGTFTTSLLSVGPHNF